MSKPSPRKSNEFAEYRFIKVMRGAPVHRKFRKLARSLEVSRFEAIGLTVALWNLCDDEYPFGVLSGLDAEALADSLGVEHLDPDGLVEAWIDAKLIDDTDAGLVVHGWLKEGRSGASAQKRSQRAKWAAHIRHHKDNFNPDCDSCGVDASEHAASQSEEYEQATQRLPDARRETRDARRETHQIATKENQTPAYASDDPERPFASHVTAARYGERRPSADLLSVPFSATYETTDL
jgi:hypothetical protein